MRLPGLTAEGSNRADLAKWFAVLAAGTLGALAVAFPQVAGETALFVAANLLFMLPIVLAAVGLSAFIRASGLDGLVSRVFQGRSTVMILAASVFGALTPICGLGVLPIIAGLLTAGVPLAPIMAFWLSSPITDPAMLLVTAGTLGLTFAVAKTAIAFAIGLAGGFATEIALRRGAFAMPLKGRAVTARAGCAATQGDSGTVVWKIWRDPIRIRVFRDEAGDAGLLIFKWLTLAFALESLLRAHLPAELIAGFVGQDNAWAIPAAVLIGTPIYLDGYAALPLVRGLMELGMAPGAAMAFLVSGGITSAYASAAVFALVRLPLFIWYLGLAVAGSTIAGYGFAAVAAW